jgi:Ni,Fe-hydrogenase III component G
MEHKQLINKLSDVKSKLIDLEQPRDNRVFLVCEAEKSLELNEFLFHDVGARFCIVTGIDAEDCFEIIYHYSYDQTGTVINIKALIRDRDNPSIESITSVVPAAEWIEREIHDILGIDFINHPNLKRLVLADDWPEGVYPLRKEVKK